MTYYRFSVWLIIKVVPGAGVEPARNYFRGILSPLRLPVPPSRHALPTLARLLRLKLEAGARIELANKGFAIPRRTTEPPCHTTL